MNKHIRVSKTTSAYIDLMSASLYLGLFGILLALVLYISTVSMDTINTDIVKNRDSIARVSAVENSMATIFGNEQNHNTISLLFLGDMMLDRGVRSQINKIGSNTTYGSTTLGLSNAHDITIANLEGPITTFPSKTIGANGKGIPGFSFTFPTSTAPDLYKYGIDIVSLANNHTDNFGDAGLTQTRSWLRLADVDFFGSPLNSTQTDSGANSLYTVRCEQRDNCIAFIGYHELSETGEDRVLDILSTLHASSSIKYIVVFAHWGHEYNKYPSPNQKRLAHQWIDNGADMIIGAHPHIVQSIETYKEKPIVYSLGNYLFDQYFSYDTTHGLALSVQIEKNKDGLMKIESLRFIPIDNTGIIVKVAGGADKHTILTELVRISSGLISTSSSHAIQQEGIWKF